MARIKIAKEAGQWDGHTCTDQALGLMQNESYRVFREKNPIPVPKPKKAPRQAPRYRVGACVAAEAGPHSDFLPALAEETLSGWCSGKLHSTKSGCPHQPNIIRWATKPVTNTRVSESTLARLVRDYNNCVMNHVFNGIVGTIMFWACKDDKHRDHLRQVRAMSYNTGARMYTLNFKDGMSFKVSPEHLDFGAQQSEHLTKGEMDVPVDYRIHPLRFVTFTPEHMEQAEKELGNFKTKSPFGSDFSASESGSDNSDVGDTTHPTRGENA